VLAERQITRPTPTLAMRRVWRLGQDKEVNVTFLAYAGTVEEEILRRMGQKKRVADSVPRVLRTRSTRCSSARRFERVLALRGSLFAYGSR